MDAQNWKDLARQILLELHLPERAREADACFVEGLMEGGAQLCIGAARGTHYGAEPSHLHVFFHYGNEGLQKFGHHNYSGAKDVPEYSGNFAVAKGAQKIAADVERRIMPGARALLKQALKWKLDAESYEARRLHNLEVVAAVVPGSVVTRTPEWQGDRGGKVDGVRFGSREFPVSCKPYDADKVEIEFRVRPEMAAALMRFFVDWKP